MTPPDLSRFLSKLDEVLRTSHPAVFPPVSPVASIRLCPIVFKGEPKR